MIWLALRATLLSKAMRIVATAVMGMVIVISGCATASTVILLDGMNARGGAGVGPQGVGSGLVLPNTPLTSNADPIMQGAFVTLPQRAALAANAGWTGDDLVTAVAVSCVEDPTGDPAVVSKTNDVGLWQVNLDYWGKQFGGQAALSVPANNADAGFYIWQVQGWRAWTTYRTGDYKRCLADARNAIGVATVPIVNDHTFPLPGWTGAIQLHWGISPGGSDLFAPRGQPVVAVAGGTVLEAGFDKTGGNAVLIKGSDGLQYYYAHFANAPLVRVGQKVNAGDQLGVVGNTGDASGGPTHLHIGIGYSILLGADAYGGTGSGFDAVSLLRQLYAGGR
jgi:murein DD-endopeptidase MepM/ murein hydrolase activator NlpD